MGSFEFHEYSWDECKRVQAVERGSIQLIYVPASLLKGRLWQAAKWSEDFRERSARSAQNIQTRFEREAPAQFVIDRLTKRWKQVHEADTDTTPVLRLVDSRFAEDSGKELTDNFYINIGIIDLAEIEDLTDNDLLNDDEAFNWVKLLREEGMYLSFPLDLDFSMLAAFPEAYQRPSPGGRGPRDSQAAIQEKKAVTLKTGGDPDLYDADYDDQFTWYPYLFLNRSKPETHMAALSQLSDQQLADDAPPELKALIERVKTALRLDGDEE
jgi:hypothetical protein